MGGQSMSLKQNTLMVFPDKTRQEISTPVGDQIVVINGGEGFTQMGDKIQPLSPAMLEEQTKEQGRSLNHLLRYHDDPALEMIAAGEEKIDGADCQILAASFKGVDSRLWVAPDGKVLKQGYQGTNPLTRAPGMVEAILSDYRPEGPLLIPHQQTRRMGGEEVMTIKLTLFEINPKVEEGVFNKPEGK